MNRVDQGFGPYLARALLGFASVAWDGLKDVAGGLFALALALVAVLMIPAFWLYWRWWVGYGNCLTWAIGRWVRHPRTTRIIRVMNSRGRSHFQVIRDGYVWEWYSAGSSKRPRYKNIWYKGECKKVGRA